MNPLSLPIDHRLAEIRLALEKNQTVIVEASPGSGKTTRVPSALLSCDFRKDREILVLEPRRLAAKLAAMRVSEEHGETVGGTIGYHFRFERVAGPKTRVCFLTEGMLMRRLLSDPKLKSTACVIIDEFHERHLHGDIAMSYLAWLRRHERPDLRIAVMSATLDSAAVTRFLSDSHLVHIDAPRFPIDLVYLNGPASKPLDQLVKEAVAKASKELPKQDGMGDILIFLPGMADILRAKTALETIRQSSGIEIALLHGELDRSAQDLALKRSQRRKVILSTNIAESSLTIEGVSIVIDSGLHRTAAYSWWSGVPSLKTRPISRASATQRAGRSGRTGPGTCYRLYSKTDFDSRPAFETPEILRADLSQTVLELKSLGIASAASFPWFESPPSGALESAETLLYRLGALSKEGSLTPIGKAMVTFPAHPRLSRLMIECDRRNIIDLGTTAAALISEGDLDSMDALESIRLARLSEPAKRLKRQFLGQFESRRSVQKPEEEAMNDLAQSLLTGFPDRVGKKRKAARGKSDEVDVVLSSGGSARVMEAGVVSHADTFIALDIQEQKHLSQQRSSLRLRCVCPIHEDWLLDIVPSAITEINSLEWDKERNRVIASSQVKYDELVLTESPSVPIPSDQSFAILLKETLGVEKDKISQLEPGDFSRIFARISDANECEAWLARLMTLQSYFPESELPDWPLLRERLLDPIRDKISLSELKELNLVASWFSVLPSSLQGRWDRLVPGTIALPSGRRSEVHYAFGKEPFVASRLQDFFGWTSGPSILDGRLKLTLHLLAPNKRAVQVTSDLAGFWEREYPRLRKELGRKYPRHAWPEDPTKQPSTVKR